MYRKFITSSVQYNRFVLDPLINLNSIIMDKIFIRYRYRYIRARRRTDKQVCRRRTSRHVDT